MPAGGRPKSPFRSGTKNPMGKDRVRDRKIKKISQMMDRRESLRKNTKPTDFLKPGGFRKLKNPKGTGAPIGGFRKPKFNPRRVKTGS